jgi:hypothetical protein
MAQDPIYRRQNVQLADVPELRMSNIQETIKGTARLEQALDRISATAFKEITEQQQKRGMEYGLENAPSLEELNEAVKSGITPAELFESDNTVFGKYAQKIQAKQVRAQLEYEARKDFTAIKELIKTGQIRDVADLDSELNGVINGPAKMLYGVDAEESVGLKTSLLQRGREIRQYGVGKIVEAQQLLFEQELEDFILDTSSSWVDKIESMPIKDPDLFKTETMNDATAIINKSGFLGAAKQAKTIERVREMQVETIKLAITNSYAQNPDFLKNPAKYLNDVDRGIVGEYTDMYASLTSSQKKDLKKDLRELYKQKHADEKFGYDLSVKEGIVEVTSLIDQYQETTDPKIQNQLITQLRDYALRLPEVISLKDIKELKDNEYKVDPAIEYSPSAQKFLERIRLGDYKTYDEMATAAKNEGFDTVTITRLFNKELASKQVRNQNAAITSIMLDNVSNKATATKKKKTEENIKARIKAKQEQTDIPFDQAAEEVKEELANEKLQRRMTSAIEDVKAQFKNFTAISELYNEDLFNKNVDVDDPSVKEILRQIENEDETAYEIILAALQNIQKIRQEMDRE